MCCNVSQCAAVYCSVVQHGAACCRALQTCPSVSWGRQPATHTPYLPLIRRMCHSYAVCATHTPYLPLMRRIYQVSRLHARYVRSMFTIYIYIVGQTHTSMLEVSTLHVCDMTHRSMLEVCTLRMCVVIHSCVRPDSFACET